MTLDSKLFECHHSPPLSEDEWDAVFRHVHAKLETFLSQEVVASNARCGIDPQNPGFDSGIEGAVRSGGPLRIDWSGRLAAWVVGDNERVHVEALLFLRNQGHRLQTKSGCAFIRLEYEYDNESLAHWRMRGWEPDEYGEFEQW